MMVVLDDATWSGGDDVGVAKSWYNNDLELFKALICFDEKGWKWIEWNLMDMRAQ